MKLRWTSALKVSGHIKPVFMLKTLDYIYPRSKVLFPGIMMIGVLFDIAVVYYAGGLEIFDDEKKDTEEAPKVTNRFGFKVYFIIKRLLFVLSELIS